MKAPLDAHDPNRPATSSRRNSHDSRAKKDFWSGAGMSELIYNSPEAQKPPRMGGPSVARSSHAQSSTGAAPAWQPGELMEHNLLRWAVEMGLSVPDPPHPSGPVEAWPEYRDQGHSSQAKIQDRAAAADSFYDYSVLPSM